MTLASLLEKIGRPQRRERAGVTRKTVRFHEKSWLAWVFIRNGILSESYKEEVLSGDDAGNSQPGVGIFGIGLCRKIRTMVLEWG
jgi:hypothetical protein